VLARSTAPPVRAALGRADAWLRSFTPDTVLDASSALLGLGTGEDGPTQRVRALGLIKEGQGPDGGWGPYVTSQSEVFDTALAVLSLSLTSAQAAPATPRPNSAPLSGAGGSTIEQQESDGSWVETTRPSGGESRPTH
jgi:hypothetical protein